MLLYKQHTLATVPPLLALLLLSVGGRHCDDSAHRQWMLVCSKEVDLLTKLTGDDCFSGYIQRLVLLVTLLTACLYCILI